MGINFICVGRSVELRDAVVRVIKESTGIAPVFQSNSETARRAHYAPAESKVIVNSAAPMMFEALGDHSACLALEVADRKVAAEKAKQIFEEAGFQAEARHDVQPEYPKGFLSFVIVPELRGVAIMFWPRPEDVTPEIATQLPAREPW